MEPDEVAAEERKALDELTPERAEEVASNIAEQWQRDWGAVLELVVAKTGLSRSDAFQFMMLRQMAMLGLAFEKGMQPKFHPDCKGCQQEKHFHELQFEVMELTHRQLKAEFGDEWQEGN